MDIQDLQTKIFESLEGIRIGHEGFTLYDRLDTLEVADIVNNLSYMLPAYPDRLVEQVDDRITCIIPKEEQEDACIRELKPLIKDLLLGNINKERLLLLVFILMRYYKLRNKDLSISEELEDVKDYYLSYAIDNNTLKEEIESNPREGITRERGLYWVRTTTDWGLIPSRKTEEKFINYLFNTKK